MDAFGRRAGDYRIPAGAQANTRLHTEGQSVGGSFIFDGGYIGTAIQRTTSLHHIPGIDDAKQNNRIGIEQTKVTQGRMARVDQRQRGGALRLCAGRYRPQ